MSDGTLIGFTSGLTQTQMREKYLDLPEKFMLEAPAEPEKEENLE